MDDQHAKGTVDKAKGEVKEKVGEVTGNDKLEGEGKIDKAKGEAREVVGDVKDAVKEGIGKADDNKKK